MSEANEIGPYVDYATSLEADISSLEAQLKEKKAAQRKLLEDEIPAAMDSLGFTEIDTPEFKLKVDFEHYASIPKARKEEVAAYAEELGCEALLSHSILQEFKKDETDLFEAAVTLLNEHQQLYAVSQNLNTGSWKKACKELSDAGEVVDWDRACIRRVRQATIKRK